MLTIRAHSNSLSLRPRASSTDAGLTRPHQRRLEARQCCNIQMSNLFGLLRNHTQLEGQLQSQKWPPLLRENLSLFLHHTWSSNSRTDRVGSKGNSRSDKNTSLEAKNKLNLYLLYVLCLDPNSISASQL